MEEEKETIADVQVATLLQAALGPLLDELKASRAQQEASFRAFKLESVQLLKEQASRLRAMEQQLASRRGLESGGPGTEGVEGSSARSRPTRAATRTANASGEQKNVEVEVFTLSAPGDKTKPGGCPSCFIAVQHLRRKGVKYRE